MVGENKKDISICFWVVVVKYHAVSYHFTLEFVQKFLTSFFHASDQVLGVVKQAGHWHPKSRSI